MDLASKARPAARIVTHGTTPPTFLRTLRPPSVLSSPPRVSGNARRSAGRHGQRPDPPEHRPEQPPRQMTLRQQEPVVAGVECRPPDYADWADTRAIGGGPRGIDVGIIRAPQETPEACRAAGND